MNKIIFTFTLIIFFSKINAQCALSSSVNATPVVTPGLNYTITGSASGGAVNYEEIKIEETNAVFVNSNSISYTFPGSGTYTVIYYAFDTTQAGCMDSSFISINVNGGGATACTALINANQSANGWYSFQASAAVPPSWIATYSWNFGDSSTGTGVQPAHQYLANGTYTVTLTVYSFDPADSTQNCTAVASFVAQVSSASSSPCTIQAWINVVADSAGALGYTFTGGWSNGTPTSYWISVNPGPTWSEEDTVSYMFPAGGSYIVSMNVVDTNAQGYCYVTAYDTIVAGGGTACNPYISGGSVSPGQFKYWANSSAPAGWITTYFWQCSQGTTSFTDTLNFQVNANGIYTFTVYAFASNPADSTQSCSGSSSLGVTVTNMSCNALFTLWQDTLNPTSWYGYNQSSGNNLQYLWDFGDGNTSTLPYPSHSYASVGSYNVCLTITDSVINCTDTYCDSAGAYKIAAGVGSLQILSPATSVSEYTGGVQVNLFPNPVEESATLTIVTDRTEALHYTVFNMIGEIVFSEQHNLSPGENRIGFSTEKLTNGVYILSISNGNKILKSVKLVK